MLKLIGYFLSIISVGRFAMAAGSAPAGIGKGAAAVLEAENFNNSDGSAIWLRPLPLHRPDVAL